MLKNHITSLSDLSGQKIRSLGGLFDTLLQGLGASPIDLTGTEVPSALSSGTVSGAFGSASVMDSTWKGLGNTDIPLGTVSPGGYYLLANRKEWAALGTADQNLLTTSWEAEFKLFQPVAPSLESQQEQIFAATSGNQIYKLKAADITKLDQISSGIWKSFKTPFPAFYKDAVSAAKMFKIKTPVSAA
jgi:TRAP-type C4-dicarboxylate transport system substrate-binding protein